MGHRILARGLLCIKHVIKSPCIEQRCYSTTVHHRSHRSSLLSCEQLSHILRESRSGENNKHCLLDATWDLEVKDYREDHFACRIPGSRFFDLELCRDLKSPYKMMLPSAREFADYVGVELGISNDSHVIIYDNHPQHAIFSSPRLWWMFRVFGHDNVSILNGGLTAWLKYGGAHVNGPYSDEHKVTSTEFTSTFRPHFVRDFDFVKNNASVERPVQLLESRGASTLPVHEDGSVNLQTSSVPCAVWTPFNQLLDPHTRTVRSPTDIQEFFTSNAIDLETNPVTTCGRGVSASIVTFCAYYATGRDLPVYDGSWSEWSDRASTE